MTYSTNMKCGDAINNLKQSAQFIITGKGSEIVKQLDNITIEGNKIPLKFLSIDGNLVERPNYDAPDGISKKDVLDKYMNAIGGI